MEEDDDFSCKYRGPHDNYIEFFIKSKIKEGKLPEGCLTCIKNEFNFNCKNYCRVKTSEKQKLIEIEAAEYFYFKNVNVPHPSYYSCDS